MVQITYILDKDACITLNDTYSETSDFSLAECLLDVILNFRWLDGIVINGTMYPIKFENAENLDKDSLRLSLQQIKI